MNTDPDYAALRREVSKDALKTMAFFFVGLPVACFVLAYLIL